MSTAQPILGLDIGGTKLAAGVVGSRGEVRAFRTVPTLREQGQDAVIARLFALGRDVVDDVGEPIGAVGIASGGPLDPTTGVLHSPLHFPDWAQVPITDLTEAEFAVPAVLCNDATAGALAEHRFGAGRGTDTMLYLTVSTGIGGGAVLDGRLLRGATGNGGEFGHVLAVRDGRLCSCGRRGCIEAYASGTNIAARAVEALLAGSASTLAASPEVTAADVARAAGHGDRLAQDIWRDTVDLLGDVLTDLVNVLQPEVVVLGGGVTRSGAMLFDPVRRRIRRTAMGPAAEIVRVLPAALGDAVCVVGAAAATMGTLVPAHV